MTHIAPGHNRLDARLALEPRAYAVVPAQFGSNPHVTFHVPPGGDDLSMQVARIQHHIVIAWRARHPRGGRRLADEIGCSKQTVSRTLLGQRFAGQAVLSFMAAQLQRDVRR